MQRTRNSELDSSRANGRFDHDQMTAWGNASGRVRTQSVVAFKWFFQVFAGRRRRELLFPAFPYFYSNINNSRAISTNPSAKVTQGRESSNSKILCVYLHSSPKHLTCAIVRGGKIRVEYPTTLSLRKRSSPRLTTSPCVLADRRTRGSDARP